MTPSWKKIFRGAVFCGLLLAIEPVRAEYRRIQLKVYGLDCELCARGVSASIHRMAGVSSVKVSLKTGILGIELAPGNTLKMSDLRNRIRENGFRPMEANVTAIGKFNGSKFDVLGTGESYDVVVPGGKSIDDSELTFEIPSH
jgi:copper chaperone CopZ